MRTLKTLSLTSPFLVYQTPRQAVVMEQQVDLKKRKRTPSDVRRLVAK